MNYIQPQNRNQVEMMSMEMLVAPDNEVRVIDAFVEALDSARLGFKHTLAAEGHPPFHPKTFLRLYLYGYMNRTRSSRRLEKECERNIEWKWLRSLKNPRWDNAYLHPKFGPMSAKLFLVNWLAHDYLHIRQIIRLKYDYLKQSSGESLAYAGDW